jgi:Putative Flp pilus-assembly TadE/G-like
VRAHRPGEERGTATMLIIGLALVLAMMAGVVTDASAAYLERQDLDTLADGAALTAADGAASGAEAYGAGLGPDLRLDEAAARLAALEYLRRVGAFARFAGLTVDVMVDATTDRVLVVVQASLVLPLHVPGSPARASIGARSSASVGVDE